MSATDRQREQLLDQLGPIVADLGFSIEEIGVTRVGRRHLVRVVVDGDDGIDLDGIALVSRAMDRSLDADDPFGSPFVLEVSSPGVDRPLTEPRRWRRNVGRLIQVEVDGRPVTGRLVSADAAGIELEGGPGRTTAGWDQLGPGRVQVEFARPAPPVDAAPLEPRDGTGD